MENRARYTKKSSTICLAAIDTFRDGSPEEQLALGYRLATAIYSDDHTAYRFQELLSELSSDEQEQVEDCLPVGYFFTPDEFAFAIQTAGFPQLEPVIGVVQDADEGFRPENGLTPLGTTALPEESYFNSGMHKALQLELFQCVLTETEDDAVLISEAVGEFWVEVYHMKADNTAVCIYREDFSLK